MRITINVTLVHGILFLLFLGTSLSKQANESLVRIGDKGLEICSEDGFSKTLKQNKAKIDLAVIQSSCNTTAYQECQRSSPTLKGNVYYVMLENVEVRKYFMRVVITDELHREMNGSECWGIGFEASSSHSKDVKYYNKTEVVSNPLNKVNTHFDIYYMMGFTYNINVFVLPNGNFFNFNWIAPGRCEILILDEIHAKLVKKGEYRDCIHYLDLEVNRDFAKNLCKTYEKKENFYNLLKDRVDVIDCVPILNDTLMPQPAPLSTQKTKKTSYMVLTVTLSTVVSVILFVLIIVIIFAKTKKIWFVQRAFFFGLGPSKTSKAPLIALNKECLTAMIIQKAGCEILEEFTQEFASFLQSYGIKVKMTSSNDHVIDAEGGIASYLQNNIKLCDVVFVMISDDEGGNKTRHKTYEFAIKMMEGFVLHNCAQTPYVPIYLTKYDQAVKHFPPFLKASTGYGYQVPDNMSRMMKKLFKMVDNSKDRHIKDNEFMKRLREYSKRFLSASHSGCNKEYCYKGEQCTISDNLSSIWASTVYSKWPSQYSIDEPPKRLDDVYELNHPFTDTFNSIGEEKQQLCIDFIQQDSITNSKGDTFSNDFSDDFSKNRTDCSTIDNEDERESRIFINDDTTNSASIESTLFDDTVDSQSLLLPADGSCLDV